MTEALTIPTIGIGSGPGWIGVQGRGECECLDASGQVLVVSDLLGYTPKSPKLAKQFVNARALVGLGISK